MKFYVVSGYGYWGGFKPTDLRDPKSANQVGGGETAMVNMSRELAALGHDVTVFYNVARPGDFEGVHYLPFQMFEAMACWTEFDVLVSWDYAQAFKYADRARCHIMAFQLNDAQVGVFDHVIDRYFCPSDWHAKRFQGLYPEITPAKVRSKLTNGLDAIRYVQDVPRDPLRVVHSSSPDRGLHHLLRIWPTVAEQVPGANLHVFYDMNKWLDLADSLAAQGLIVNTYDRAMAVKEQMQRIKAGVNGLSNSVTFHGSVGQWQLAREQLQSGVMCYPCDPVQPTEGFSMSCLEGIAAGCKLITSNADALPELWTDAPDTVILPLPVDDGVWTDAIIRALTTEPGAGTAKVPQDYMWRAIAAQWEKEISECLTQKQT